MSGIQSNDKKSASRQSNSPERHRQILSRREFCLTSTVAGVAAFAPALLHATKSGIQIPDVAAIDRQRILSAANRYLSEQPVTITSFSSQRSAGGKHDYFSEGDYWWPDPKNPSGPYIRRDGLSNPENFNDHRRALIRLSVQVPALAAAWSLTKDRRFADHAAVHLRAWFVADATRMNPNLQFAQAIHGVSTGRGIGVIDTLHLVEVVRATQVLIRGEVVSSKEAKFIQDWFASYLQWMTTSKNGLEERDAENNHGTCWLLQASQFARFTANKDVADFCRKRFKEAVVPKQIAPDGSFPLELQRTKPYGYSIFNLDVMSGLCQVLSEASENLFAFALPDGRGFAKAMAFMFPFIADKSSWPYPHDVEYFQDWPVRQPSLLFAGAALSQPQYFKTWRSLNPDPTVDEIIRNYPIRQPLLWLPA